MIYSQGSPRGELRGRSLPLEKFVGKYLKENQGKNTLPPPSRFLVKV